MLILGYDFVKLLSDAFNVVVQRLSRLEEEEKNLIETTQRKFFAQVLDAVREFQLQIQMSQKRRKQRNDGVQVLSYPWHNVFHCSFFLPTF